MGTGSPGRYTNRCLRFLEAKDIGNRTAPPAGSTNPDATVKFFCVPSEHLCFSFLRLSNAVCPISDMFAPLSKRAAIGAPITFTVTRGSIDLGVGSTVRTAEMSTVGDSGLEVP